MTPMQRLLEEAVPVRPTAPAPFRVWTTEEQDRHWADLCHAVGTPDAKRPERPAPSSPDDEAAAA